MVHLSMKELCWVWFGREEKLLRVSVRKACSELNPAERVRVWIMCVQRRYALYIHSSDASLDHVGDSYCRVRSLMRVRTGFAVALPVDVPSLSDMSIALNINDRKVGKSRSFRVGMHRWLGFSEIAPVIGSITISPCFVGWYLVRRWWFRSWTRGVRAARYWSLFGSGVLLEIEMAWRFSFSRHFLTRISSWENDHSSADRTGV